MPEEKPTDQQRAAMQALCGEQAQAMWLEAQAETDPTNRANKQLAAERLSSARRKDLIELAGADVVRIVIPSWIAYMPITRRKQLILGRIWSFQAVQKDCRLSLSGLANAAKLDRKNVKHDLTELVRDQYLTKIVNGVRKPATYSLDVPRCMEAAIANGWEPVRHTVKGGGKETAQQDGEQHKQ